jgi:Tfp pilus assembly protein PilO
MSLGPKAFHAAGTLRNGKTSLHNYHAELVMAQEYLYALNRQTPAEVDLLIQTDQTSAVLMGLIFERIQRSTTARHLPFPIHLWNTGGSDTSLTLK